MKLPPFALLVLLVACSPDSDTSTDPTEPVRLDVIREVAPQLLEDESEWGDELDLSLEAEFWDTIANSDHAHYEVWAAKTRTYIAANPDAMERLNLFLTAGAVFQVSQAFGGDEADVELIFQHLGEILVGADHISKALPYHLPAQVFANNNLSMRGLMLGPMEEGLDYLEALLEIPGSEGRAAAPFTYGMIYDETAVRYAISLNEECQTFVCNWTSQIAPYKPIGQLMMLAELHGVLGEFDQMNDYLDRAEDLAIERDWPFMERIDQLREELPRREYISGAEKGVGTFRWPMPIYSNEVNCSNCHIGAIAGRSGQSPETPYPWHYITTPAPDPPDLSHLAAQ